MQIARRLRRYAAPTALLLTLAACSGSGSPKATTGSTTTDSARPGSPERRVETITLEAADYGTISAKIPEKPLATAPSAVEGIDIEIYGLNADEKATTLVLALLNKNSTNAGFASTDYYSEDPGGSSVSAISLFDPKGLKQYLTFRQPGNDPSNPKKLGPCLCSSAIGILGRPPNSPGAGMNPGQRTYLAAIFPAPPPEVAKLTVQAGFGAVPDVPVSRG